MHKLTSCSCNTQYCMVGNMVNWQITKVLSQIYGLFYTFAKLISSKSKIAEFTNVFHYMVDITMLKLQPTMRHTHAATAHIISTAYTYTVSM